MSWNEPGGGNKGPRDPWGGGNQGPPDLDEAFKKLQQRLSGMFGGGRGGSGPAKGGLSGALLGMVLGGCCWYGASWASISSTNRSGPLCCALVSTTLR